MKIHVLMENSASSAGFVAEHGLSLLVETAGKSILFDAGASAAFADNAERMGIDLSRVEFAVLSHGHYDHGGGLARFLEVNKHAAVWVSAHAFEPHFNASGKDIGLDTAMMHHPRIRKVATPVFSPAEGMTLFSATEIPVSYGLDTSGMSVQREGKRIADDFRHEQYLLVEEQGKRVLFSGCSHRGILNIAGYFRADVLVGGFHFMKLSPVSHAALLNQAADVLLQLPTQYLTGHCTGAAATHCLKKRMQDRLHSFSAGQIICL